MPVKVRTLLSASSTVRLLSSVSITEIVLKTALGKLNIPEPSLDQLICDLQLTMLPHTPTHARRMYGLPMHHREPFDRMLIAVALVEDIPIVTSDKDIEKYSDMGLKVVRY